MKLVANKNKRIELINKFIETKDPKFIEELKGWMNNGKQLKSKTSNGKLEE